MAALAISPSGINPWVIGQLSPNWKIPLNQGPSGAANLSGVNPATQLSLVIYTVSSTGIYTKTGVGQGSFAIQQNYPGVVVYTPNANDFVAAGTFTAPGLYAVRVEVNYAGTTPFYTDYIPVLMQG